MPIKFLDPNRIDGEMYFDELFNHMTALARRKITQRTFELYTRDERFLNFEYTIAVIVRAEFTYKGMNILSDDKGSPIKWVTLTPRSLGLSINQFLSNHYNWNNTYSYIRPFLYHDTHESVMFSKSPSHIVIFHNLQEQVLAVQQCATDQILKWKSLLPYTRTVLSKTLDSLGDYYNRLVDSGDMNYAEALRRKLDILSEVDPDRKQKTVWENHASKASYGVT